jgi:hypothetical protein
MAINSSVTNISGDEQTSPSVSKKPYEKPSFRFEQVFVTSALSCGKVEGGITSPCLTTPKVS